MAVPGPVSDRASLSAAVDKRASAGPRCPAAPPRPLQRAPGRGGGAESFSRDLPGLRGFPRVRGEMRRPGEGEGCPGRRWVRSNEDSPVTRGALFLPRWSGEKGLRSCWGCGAALASSPPAPRPSWGCRAGWDRGTRPGAWGTRFPSEQRELPLHPAPAASLRESLTSPGLSVRLLPGKDSRAQPCGTVSFPPCHSPFLPPIWEGASSRAALPKGPRVFSCRGITAGDGGPDGWPWAQENPFGLVHPSGGALSGARGRRSPAEPGGGEGGGPAACENCYFSSITRNLCKCPGQDTSRPAGWGHGDNTAMEKSKLHLLTSSQIQITALAWRGEESERSM